VGPPIEEPRGTFTGAVTKKKVEIGGIVPRFTRTYPKNLEERWNGAVNGINSYCAAIPH
jgi:hypothetical protein